MILGKVEEKSIWNPRHLMFDWGTSRRPKIKITIFKLYSMLFSLFEFPAPQLPHSKVEEVVDFKIIFYCSLPHHIGISLART